MYSWKKKNVGGNNASTSATSTPSKPVGVGKKNGTGTPAKTPRTPKSGGKKKLNATPTPEPELEDDDEEMFQDSPLRNRGGGESDEDEGYERMAKKVKTEIVEDEGVDGFEV